MQSASIHPGEERGFGADSVAAQKDGFLVVQVLMDAGVARNFGANDIVLVTKDDPRARL